MSDVSTMLEPGTFRDGWTLARVELLTYVRFVRDNRRRTIAVLVSMVAFALIAPLMVIDRVLAFGSQLAGGSIRLGTGGLAFGVVAVGGGYVGAATGFNQTRVGRSGPLVRTSIPPVAVSLGRFLNETIQGLVVFVLPLAVLLAGVAVGAGGPVVPLLVGLGGAVLLTAAVVAGRIGGVLARYVNERLQVSLWIKAAIFLVLMGGIFVATQVLLEGNVEDAGSAGQSLAGQSFGGPLLPGTPLQAYASVVFAPLGATPQPIGLLVAGLVVVAIPVGLAITLGVETHLLVRDLGSDATASRVSGTRGVPRVFEYYPSSRIAWRHLLRTRRDPRTLAHLTPLLFGAMGMGASAVQDPGILVTIGPAAAVVAGAVLAGAAFCLNPLGDDRDQLPLLLTSTPSLAVMLRGRMVAGIALGLVVAIGIGGPLGLVEHGPVYVLAQSLLGIFLAVVSAGVAVGIGAVVPKFEQREYMSIERAHPSTMAMIGFFTGGMLVGLVGFVLLWLTLSGRVLLPVAFGWLVYVLVLGFAAYGGYRYAIGRVDSFTLDSI